MESTRYGSAAAKQLDLTFAALANPTRRAILARLASGAGSVNELAEPFAISQPAVSRHLMVLERAGLISSGSEAQRRPRKLELQPLADVAKWLEKYREFWDASFKNLDDVLNDLQGASRPRRRRVTKRPKRSPDVRS